jgi:hypothetical protein
MGDQFTATGRAHWRLLDRVTHLVVATGWFGTDSVKSTSLVRMVDVDGKPSSSAVLTGSVGTVASLSEVASSMLHVYDVEA